MIIAVDFDGTIVKDEYPRIGPLVADAAETLTRLKKEGHEIIINTCRTGELALEAVNFLLSCRVPFDRVNENNPHNVRFYGSNPRKIYADCYIDDRNAGGLPDWQAIYSWVAAKVEEKREASKTV